MLDDYWRAFWWTVLGAAGVIGIGTYVLITGGNAALVAIGGM